MIYVKEQGGRPAQPTDGSVDNDLIWGINPVLEYLKTSPAQVREISVLKAKSNDRIQQIIDLARTHKIKVSFTSSFHALPDRRKISHQGVIARVSPHPAIDLDKLLAELSGSAAPPFLLALDSIQDPHNLGAIIRTAGAAGVDGIILPKDRSASTTGTAAKVSAGAIAHVNICMVTNLAETLKKLKIQGIWIVGSAARESGSLYKSNLTGPVCLVVGSEAKGLRPLVRKQCDFLVSVPMQSELDSLNASVAAALLLFEVVRQRGEFIVKSEE